MNISSSSFNSSMMQQVQPSQRSAPPSAAQLSSKVMEINDLNSDSLLSIDEVKLSDETFSFIDEDGDGFLSSGEIETSFSAMLESMKNQTTSPEEFGELLTNMGLDVPPPPSQSASKVADGQVPPPPPPSGGGDATASEEYEEADINEDGIVTAAEQAEYDGTTTNKTEYTMKIVSTLLDALKKEEDSSSPMDLSKYKSIMSMVNNELQDSLTAKKLNSYVSNLDLGLKTA